MESAGKILGRSKASSRFVSREELAQAAWRAAVGKRLSSHTRPGKLYGTRLIVEVEDSVWSYQLGTLAPDILRKIAIHQPNLVTSFEFRVTPPRRMPATASRPVRGSGQLSIPYSERIEDPVLSRIYQASRRRALA